MTRLRFVSILLICLLASVVMAQVQEQEIPSDDPVIEQRLAKLSQRASLPAMPKPNAC